MSQQFKVQFHRYNSKSGQSRLSAVTFISAETFHDATGRASLMASAMGEVDRSNRYVVASVETVGLRGDICSVGWETSEEFSERVIREMSDGDLKVEIERLESVPFGSRDENFKRRLEVACEETNRRNI